MASALMTWVWIGLLLAQINNAESHQSGHGTTAGRGDNLEHLRDVLPHDRTKGTFLSPVWTFADGKGALTRTIISFILMKIKFNVALNELTNVLTYALTPAPPQTAHPLPPLQTKNILLLICFLLLGGSDIDQPQYRCQNGTLHLRFSKNRFSKLKFGRFIILCMCQLLRTQTRARRCIIFFPPFYF